MPIFEVHGMIMLQLRRISNILLSMRPLCDGAKARHLLAWLSFKRHKELHLTSDYLTQELTTEIVWDEISQSLYANLKQHLDHFTWVA